MINMQCLLKYDAETGEFTWLPRGIEHFPDERAMRSWNAKYAEKLAGTCDPRGYKAIRVNGQRYWAHRMAFLFVHGRWPEGQVDHANGNKSDNRISNLRECSNSENHKNMPMSSRNKSGANGISWSKGMKRWKAQGISKGKTHVIGYFGDISDAVAARQRFNQEFGFSSRHGAVK